MKRERGLRFQGTAAHGIPATKVGAGPGIPGHTCQRRVRMRRQVCLWALTGLMAPVISFGPGLGNGCQEKVLQPQVGRITE